MKRTLVVMAILIIAGSHCYAGTLTHTYKPVTGDAILAVHITTNANDSEAVINGNIESSNIKDDTIAAADLNSAIAITTSGAASFTGTFAMSGVFTYSGTTIQIDDGSGATGSLIFQDGTDENVEIWKVDGSFLGISTEAVDGINILGGNIKVGDGTPTGTLNGEDCYIEGFLEVDGATDLDGALDVAGASTVAAITASGAVIAQSTLAVTGAATLSSTLDVAGTVLSQGNLTIGDGTAATDFTTTYNGEDNDYLETWMEDEDYLKINDGVLLNSAEQLYFRDTNSFISSTAPGILKYDSSTNWLYSNIVRFGRGGDVDIYTRWDANSNDGYQYWMEDEDYFRFNDDILMNSTESISFNDTGEKISGDGTDLTIGSGALINLTATTDVAIPANVGVTFGTGEKVEGDNTDLTITSGADIALTATSDVNIPASVGLTLGDDGEKIEGDGTNMTIASSNNLTISATTATIINGPVDVLGARDTSTYTMNGSGVSLSGEMTTDGLLSAWVDSAEASAVYYKMEADTNNPPTTEIGFARYHPSNAGTGEITRYIKKGEYFEITRTFGTGTFHVIWQPLGADN